MEKERIQRVGKSIALILAEAGLYFALFFTEERIQPIVSTKILLAVLSLISGMISAQLLWGEAWRKRKEELKLNKRKTILLLCVAAVLSSLFSFAQRFFLNGNVRAHFSLPGLLYCILGTLWFVPLLLSILTIMQLLSEKKKEQTVKKYDFLLFFLLYALCQSVLFLQYRPGGFPPDSVSQLFQAIGFEKISDWHPALHTLFMRLILRVSGNRAMVIVYVQMIAFAALIAAYVCRLTSWGCHKWLAATGGLIFQLLPNQVLNATAAVKDFPYTLSLMWLTLMIIKLTEKEKRFSLWNSLQLMTALFLVYGFRHNGVIPAAFVIVLLLWISLRKRNVYGWKPVVSAAGAILMIVLYKGPVFSAFDVQPNTASPYTTMLCAVGSCINKGLPLSEEANGIMESVIPMEDWAAYYDRYQGHDKYLWGRGEEAEFDASPINARKAFRVYLEALCKYPDVVIKDRLDGMDLLWNVAQPNDSFNAKCFEGVYLLPYAEQFFYLADYKEVGYRQFVKPSMIADQYRKTQYTDIRSASDMLLWRSGSYMILLTVVFLYITGKEKKKIGMAAAPLIGNIAGLMLLLYHQSFRYVYAVQILTLMLFFAAIYGEEGKRKEQKMVKNEGN